jgi:electron transport complex protein RnfG
MKKDSTAYKVILLGVLCAICGLLLTMVNNLTAPVIEAQAVAAEKENLDKIYPGADFTEITDFTDDTGLVESVFEAEGEGYVFKVNGMGYNSNGFTFMVAFNYDGSCAGFTAVEQNESPGIGSRCFEDEYVSQVEAITATEDAPLLSGATLTSTAIQKGVAAAEAVFASLNG